MSGLVKTSPEESAMVKELLVKHSETSFDDPEKPLTRTDTIEHKILTSGRPVRIPPHRVALDEEKLQKTRFSKWKRKERSLRVQDLGVLLSSW